MPLGIIEPSSVGGSAGASLSEASTSDVLLDTEIFESGWIDVSSYPSAVVAYFSDKGGILSVQFSTDEGSTVDSNLSFNYIGGTKPPPRRFSVGRVWLQVRFENNSGEDQTEFRLSTLVGSQTQLNFPIDGLLPQTADAAAVRNDNFFMDVGNGRRQGQAIVQKWGYNLDLDSASQETLWAGGPDRLSPLTTPRTLSVVSDDTDDDISAGAGARSIRIYGIGPNRESQTEDLDLTGTTPVVTTGTWLGINRVSITSAGSTMANVGDITLTATVDLTVQALVTAGTSSTQQLFYFCPAEEVVQLDYLRFSCLKLSGGGAPRVTITAHLWDFDANVVTEVFREALDTTVTNLLEVSPKEPFTLLGGDLLEFRATTTVNDTTVTGRFSGVRFEDVPALSVLDI